MIILGVNGGIERSHDASACLIIGNEIIAMAEEERFIRKKNAFDVLPLMAVAFCLYEGGIKPDDVDVIAWGWDLPALYAFHGRKFPLNEEMINMLLFPRKQYPERRKTIPVVFVDHHLSHAASVYCCRKSNKKMAVVVVDGSGESESISIFEGHDGRLKKVLSFPIHVSPGFFYGAGCKYLGFSSFHGGKLMGLASYGREEISEFYSIERTDILVPFSDVKFPSGGLDWQDNVINKWLEIFEKRFGSPIQRNAFFDRIKGQRLFSPDLSEKEKNVAFSIQKELERVYMWCVKQAIDLTKSDALGLAGGVALNCSANGLVVDSKIAGEVYLQPASGDAGTSLGAAVSLMEQIPIGIFEHPYLGPECGREELQLFLKSVDVKFRESPDVYKDAIEMISSGKIVAWFNGRMEIGPRALGNRSILADPRKRNILDSVNVVKSREWWRPLAPCVIDSCLGTFFTGEEKTPYMLMRKFVHPDVVDIIPAVVHVDNSARPQTVSEESNRDLFRLLKEAENNIGVPVLINTSFNVGNEPIVCSPLDAIKTFFSSGIDVLVMNPFVVEKRSL